MGSSQVPTHFNQQYAGLLLKWSGTDTQTRYEENCKDPAQYKKLVEAGWIDCDIVYSYNSQGFRDEEFNQQPSAIAIGCSHTEGVGLPADLTWPRQLEKMMGIKVWNLGVGGSAMDTCFRLLEYWIQQLNVKYVFCAVPDMARYEIFENGNWSNILPTLSYGQQWINDFNKNYIVFDENQRFNRQKNLLAAQQLCNLKSAKFYFDTLGDFFDKSLGRDLSHAGATSNQRLAEKFFNMARN